MSERNNNLLKNKEKIIIFFKIPYKHEKDIIINGCASN